MWIAAAYFGEKLHTTDARHLEIGNNRVEGFVSQNLESFDAIVRGTAVVGRRREEATLDRLLDAARRARSGVLVLRGDPGVGKTSLLEYA